MPEAAVRLDPGILADLLALDGGGEPVVLREIMETYLQDAEASLQAMQQASERGDAEALRARAHSLKGGCRAIGAVDLASLCATLEQTPPTEAAPIVARARVGFDGVRAAIALLLAPGVPR